jgi:hypothetical protein
MLFLKRAILEGFSSTIRSHNSDWGNLRNLHMIKSGFVDI